MFIHLKSIKKDPQEFALLVEPNLLGEVYTDEELYRKIDAIGYARIQKISVDFLNLGEVEELKPTDFEASWRGD